MKIISVSDINNYTVLLPCQNIYKYQRLFEEIPYIDYELACMYAQMFSHACLFETLRTTAYQVPLSVGFSRQEYWSRLIFLSPGIV